MENTFCFDCLERLIRADYSDKLIFSYGLSDSPLPTGSSAVVQMPGSDGEASATHFVLKYLRRDRRSCLANYIDDCIQGNDNHESNDTIFTETDKGQVNGKHEHEAPPASISEGSQERLNGCKHSSVANLAGSSCSEYNYSCKNKFSCIRTMNSLVPLAYVALCTYSVFEDLASNFLSGSLEDHILCSLSLLIEGKATGRDALNFLKLVGVPSFEENGGPGSLRHPNIAPVLGILNSADHINVVLPKVPVTLQNILHFSPNAVQSDWDIRFLVYQILSALAYLHGLGFAHGNIKPSTIVITESRWSWISITDKPGLGSMADDCGVNTDNGLGMGCCINDCVTQGLYNDLKLQCLGEWHSGFKQWWKGELSNFDYLLILNRLAGRRWGDHTFHPVMPWVIDFSTRPDENCDAGWRDLSKSKWRLAKGDEQLDFTYLSSEIPHHVSDECLSELAVCSYKARRLPLSILRLAVRSVYEPNEYPSTMQRLYQWTPDECIPEFFFDPQIFNSIHCGMTNLAVPSWASSPEEFIRMHRDALECERVSCQLHNWIDITFGYKMSGQAAIDAKNVMLSSSEPAAPRSVGRRQLFTQPHPMRKFLSPKACSSSNVGSDTTMNHLNQIEDGKQLLSETAYLHKMEEAYAFSEHNRHLSPCYHCHVDGPTTNSFSREDSPAESIESTVSRPGVIQRYGVPYGVNLNYLLDYIEEDNEGSMGYHELLLWRRKLPLRTLSAETAEDIFSIGCILAELHLKKPLFDATSLELYLQEDILPGSIQELPPHTRVIVEACIQRESTRRPSAKHLLESPYFPATIKSTYLFVSPIQLIAKDGSRLQYLSRFAKHGALKAMGTFAAEKCASFCLPLLVTPLSDTEAEWACILLEELIKNLKPSAVKTLVLPSIQKILQATGCSRLKVSLLQDSFVREIWNRVGKYAYLEKIHPLVISNLHSSPHKTSATAASVLLIGSSEELGVPITIHQTILPLMHCFGKGLGPDGIDVLIRIGGLLGDTFVSQQMLPLLRHMVHVCINVSCMNKPEPVQSWSGLALVDCLITLDGLLALLPGEAVVKELIKDGHCLHVIVLKQTSLEITVLQVAANTLMTVCQRIGPDLTALHVLPQVKDLFDELAFSQQTGSGSSVSLGRNLKASKLKVNEGIQIESRMDLVLLLYPSFACFLGIEKLRQCCATWLLLEQFLLRRHNWKWEHTRESTRSSPENLNAKRPIFIQGSRPEYNPSKSLLNGVGWSIPQSQGNRVSKNVSRKRFNSFEGNATEEHLSNSNLMNHEPWLWFPSPVISWDGPEYLARVGSIKDELPWKIRASVVHSVRAHNGALRSLAGCQDESTAFTAGIGPGFKGTVQKWDLTRMNCISGYYGHEEVVNDICVLSTSERIASCDGTLHVWNGRTGKVISVFAEPSTDSTHFGSPLLSPSNLNGEQGLNSNTMSSGILSSAFDGSLYTCMHHLEFSETLVIGTGNGSLRFIDVSKGQKLHSWRGESVESGFPSLVSALCSCGSDNTAGRASSASPSWIASGLSSGHCRLFDLRSGNVVASWRAHDGYVTKLAAPESHLLVSSSLDKTLRVWDLRRNLPSQVSIFKGHTDGVSSFSMWGQDIVSISKNKIGVSSLSKSSDEDGLYRVVPQKLNMGNHGVARNLSNLTSICILPFSRLFLVGTEDGYLRTCC